MSRAGALLVLVAVPMLLEARVARRNERVLRANGAREPPDDVFAIMRIAYPVCFLAMITEGWYRARGAWRALVVPSARPARIVTRHIRAVPIRATPQLCGSRGRVGRRCTRSAGAADRTVGNRGVWTGAAGACAQRESRPRHWE